MKKKINQPYLKKLWRKIRRPLIYHFRPRYAMLSLTLRKGGCRQCSCCSNNRIKICKNQDEKGRCKVYYTLKQPVACVLAPIDYKDVDFFEPCGYYWTLDDLKRLGVSNKEIKKYFSRKKALEERAKKKHQ